MKRPGYKEAVAWIALNDSISDYGSVEELQENVLITIALIADLFGKEDSIVALDVWRYFQGLNG